MENELSIDQVGADLTVSQFTFADTYFTELLVLKLQENVSLMKQWNLRTWVWVIVETGEFLWICRLVNDGPVTILLTPKQ